MMMMDNNKATTNISKVTINNSKAMTNNYKTTMNNKVMTTTQGNNKQHKATININKVTTITISDNYNAKPQ
jgi:hypothetical protein